MQHAGLGFEDDSEVVVAHGAQGETIALYEPLCVAEVVLNRELAEDCGHRTTGCAEVEILPMPVLLRQSSNDFTTEHLP